MTYRADPELAAVLADALAGRPLSRRRARQVAAGLRTLVEHSRGPVAGAEGALRAHLLAAAELLDAQADQLRSR